MKPSDVPHAMVVSAFPFGECGTDYRAHVIIRHSFLDTQGTYDSDTIFAELRRRMADTLDRPIERINIINP